MRYAVLVVLFVSLFVSVSALAPAPCPAAENPPPGSAVPDDPSTAGDAEAEPIFTPAESEALVRALESERDDLGLVGGIVGVWDGEGAEWVQQIGAAARDGEPIQRDTHLRIGSVTKTFTGELILRLADEGKLSLDDPVSRYVDSVPNGDEVTLRHLGRMESGYATYTYDPEFQQAIFSDPERSWTPGELLEIAWENTRAGCPHSSAHCFEPGTAFAYSNTNLALLGLVAEKVTGQPLRELFRRYFFEPLGMDHTSMPTDASLPTPYAHGYSTQGCSETTGPVCDITKFNPTWGYGTGDLVSTLDDLRIWARVAGSGSRLAPASRAERFFASRLPPSRPGTAYSFALGINHGEWWGHTGSIPGFTTTMLHHPYDDLTVVVMTNGDELPRKSDPEGRRGTPSKALARLVVDALTDG